jgi:protease secretion system membrane fusion protein
MLKTTDTAATFVMPNGPQPGPAAPTPEQALAARVRWTRWIVGALLLVVVLWVALAPLDEGVPAPAQVVVDTRAKPVQHATGGVVLEVLAREGMAVRAGQPLLRLDTAATAAVHEAVRQRYHALRATQSRLLAERDGLARIRWHQDLQGDVAADHRQAQELLMAARRQALDAELAALNESRLAQQGALASTSDMLVSRRQQLQWLREELDNTAPLVQDGYVPRNRLLELQRQRAEADTLIAELLGQRERAQRAQAEIAQRRLQRLSEFRSEVQTQLSEVLRDVEADAQRLVAARQDMQRTEVLAPVDGHVIGLAVQSAGAVVQPAQRLMDIVPQAELLLVEARVAPHLADRIRTGQAVDIRFAAFAHTPQLLVRGEVLSVSADALTDPQSQQSYFLARLAMTAEGLRALGDRQLVPGLPAEVVFRTGERSLLTYWLHPLTKRLAASMKEE